MEFMKIALIILIIVGTIIFYKFVPTTFKKFVFFLIIFLGISYLVFKYLVDKTGGINQ